MSNEDLQRKPHNDKSGQMWWYEEPAGMTFVVWPSRDTREFVIPWRSIRAALRRKEK
jgi:hypothetical protein